MKVTWTNDSGVVLEMGDGLAVTIVRGVGGLDAPPLSLQDVQRGQAAGAYVTGYRWKTRTVTLPVSIERSAWNDVVAALATPAGTLKVERNRSGQGRAYYIGGLDTMKAYPGEYRGVLMFKMPWPFFLSSSEVYKAFVAEERPLAYPMGFPFYVLAGSTLADVNVTNNGETEAWPQWRLTGPAGQWELRNITTGKTLRINHPLGDGEVLHITTRPGEGAVYDESGNSVMGDVSGALWPLARGENHISVIATDPTVATRAELWYADEYLGV